MASPDGLYRLTTTPSFAPISFHFQITKNETENKKKKTVSATEPVVGSPFLAFLQTPVCLSPPIITYFKANENTTHKKEKAHIYTIIFPFLLPFIFLSFLGFTKHFTKSEGKKGTKHIHTGLLLQFQQRLILVTTTENKTETKSRKKIWPPQKKQNQKKKTKQYTTYLKLLPRRRRLHCEETLVCVLLPQRPSAAAKGAAAIAGRERGMVAMAMTFVTGRKEYGQNYGQEN